MKKINFYEPKEFYNKENKKDKSNRTLIFFNYINYIRIFNYFICIILIIRFIQKRKEDALEKEKKMILREYQKK